MEEENENLDETMKDELKEQKQKEDNVVKSKIKKQAEAKVKEKTKKARKKIRQALFKRVGAGAITSFAGVFIIIFMLIGIISFITTMPGLVQDMIYDKVFEFAGKLDEWWSGENKFLNDPDSEEMKKGKMSLLNYLKDMDIDPVGLGFVASVTTNDSGEIVSYDNELHTPDELKSLTGSEKSSEDILYKYIIANERTYLPDDDGFRSKIGNYDSEYFGMLKFNEDNMTSWTDMTVDRENASMEIKAINNIEGIIYDQVFSYDLDSWVGRYGKSTELLLALHIATMSSDLTEEFISNEDLQTKVNIDIDGGEYNVEYSFKIIKDDGEEVDIPIKFGADSQDELCKKIESAIEEVTDEDGNVKLQVNLEKIDGGLAVSDITVCSLLNLINDFKYTQQDDTQSDEFMDKVMVEALDSFLGNGQYFVKNEVAASKYLRSNTNFVYSTYLCKASGSNWTPDTSSGLFSYDGVLEYDEGNGNWYYLGNNDEYYSFNIKQRLNNPNEEDGINGRTTYGVYGLKYYIDNIDQTSVYSSLMYDKNTQDAITGMLMQIDQYFKYNQDLLQPENYNVLIVNPEYADGGSIYDGGDVSFNNFNYYTVVTDNVDAEDDNGQIYVNYSKQWYDCLNRIQNLSAQEAKAEIEKTLNNIYNEISSKTQITNNKDEYIQQIIDQLLKDVVKVEDEEVRKITVENLQLMHSAVGNGVGDAKLNIPRIKSVKNHWFKDLDFSDSYVDTSNSFTAEYVSNDENVKITAEFSGNTSKQQKSQPYVIKGNVVTLDGKVVTEEYYNNPIKAIDTSWGSGYEASKKIFTQGYYYVYDGSAETSKGIYFNKLLEKVLAGKVVCVHVRNGRISSIFDTENKPDQLPLAAYEINIEGVLYDSNKWNDGLKTFEKYEEYKDPDGYYEIAHFFETTTNQGDTVEWYLINIKKQLKYLSPTSNSYEDTKASVERINNALSYMEVINLRRPVSFDHVITETVTEDGEMEETKTASDITALTAFSILEGMKTVSSQYIYRDLKEFLIELGYYTKAEFEYLSTNTLSWLLPAYIPRNATDSGHWQENEEEDALKYGAMLYSQKVDEETGEITKEGFTEDLEIVAPGNCRILEVDEDTIEIEFDGISQPEIGMLDKYTMIIKGVKISTSDLITVLDEDEITEIEITVQEAIDGENIVKMGSKIALTGTEDLQIILKNNKGAILSNVEDYMGPKVHVNMVSELSHDEKVLLFWTMYESGDDPGIAGIVKANKSDPDEEGAVGVAQWTTDLNGNHGIQDICQRLYDKDPAFCASLSAFVGWTNKQVINDLAGSNSQIKVAFRSLADKDYDYFKNLQYKLKIEETQKQLVGKGLEWVLEDNVLTGAFMPLLNWRPGWPWEDLIDESMSKEEIIVRIHKYAWDRSDESGAYKDSWRNRWCRQAMLCIDMLNNRFTDIDGWFNGTAGNEYLTKNMHEEFFKYVNKYGL